ncbi:vacuolar protein sorting protein 72 [Striga asiatica]|uniref:Vacuolar protein sorting protein 72 n=1 Tax=Striga asiatica TaxID=4170 RepID=A0A5A7R492_STRAF|nr:vacuolar protein sorting protein 72 [Striga asiatica]
MDTSKEEAEQHTFLDRASRATRGKRLTKLVDEELEEDELFWNQDALKEEEHDAEYEEEGEVADVFDSDFDESEPEPDQEVENEPNERRTKKKLIFPGKPSAKKKKKKKDTAISKSESVPKDEKSVDQLSPEHHDDTNDAEAEKTVRKSTRTSVIIRQAERDAIRAALQATMKPIKRKKEGEEKRMTQEEMLLEAAQTEIMNLRNLEKVLAREEEVKKRAIVHKAVYTGNSYLDFMNGASFDSEVSTSTVPFCQISVIAAAVAAYGAAITTILHKFSMADREKAVCAVTGLPAIYRDPKTGLPYATKEAFKIIRERFNQEKSFSKEDRSMGLLSDAAYEQGFTQKRRRSLISRDRETPYVRQFGHYHKIPAPEDEDSE